MVTSCIYSVTFDYAEIAGSHARSGWKFYALFAPLHMKLDNRGAIIANIHHVSYSAFSLVLRHRQCRMPICPFCIRSTSIRSVGWKLFTPFAPLCTDNSIFFKKKIMYIPLLAIGSNWIWSSLQFDNICTLFGCQYWGIAIAILILILRLFGCTWN